MPGSGFVPRYQKIYQRLRDEIMGGRLTPGAQLPCERELCDAYGVQRITVRRALDMLVQENLVFKRPGIGTFVRSVLPADSLSVTMRFDVEVFNEVIGHFGPGPVIVREPDGRLCITGSVTPDDAFFGWVVGLGPSAEILTPESAKRRMCALIEGVQARYLGA